MMMGMVGMKGSRFCKGLVGSCMAMQYLGVFSTMRLLLQPSKSGWHNRIVTGCNFLTPLARE